VPQDEVRAYRPGSGRAAATAGAAPIRRTVPGLAAALGAAQRERDPGAQRGAELLRPEKGGEAEARPPDWAVARPRGQAAPPPEGDASKALRKAMGPLKKKLAQIGKLKERREGGDRMTQQVAEPPARARACHRARPAIAPRAPSRVPREGVRLRPSLRSSTNWPPRGT